MTFGEIEALLGDRTVQHVEAAIMSAFKAAENCENQAEGATAVKALLVYTLAAAIITPRDGAVERAKDYGQHLIEIIEHTLATTADQLRPERSN